MANDNGDKGRLAVAVSGAAAATSVVALIAALTKKAKAAPAPGEGELPPITLILDEQTKQALAAILSQQLAANQTLNKILTVLGEVPGKRLLEPFQYKSQTLQKGIPFGVYESKPGKGSLIWAIFDVSDPDTEVSFRIDDLVWTFKFDTLLTQGIQQPLFPGAWLSKADAIAGHYCIIFSAGTIDGFVYEQRLIITLTFQGTGTATLHEGRGINWTYL